MGRRLLRRRRVSSRSLGCLGGGRGPAQEGGRYPREAQGQRLDLWGYRISVGEQRRGVLSLAMVPLSKDRKGMGLLASKLELELVHTRACSEEQGRDTRRLGCILNLEDRFETYTGNSDHGHMQPTVDSD